MADAPSMPAGSHEMRENFSYHDPPRPSHHTAPSITPYLGLRARLSQIWFNRWTILLLLVLVRTLIGISSINSDLNSARTEALSACSDVESMGSAMASMPHYMSQGLNELAATGVEKAVNGLMQTTMLSVTGMEEIVLFVIHMMTSTYLCLITFAVTGSLQSVIGAVESAQSQLNQSTQALGNDMADAVSTFITAYDSFIKDLDSVAGALGSHVTAPTLNLTNEMDQLKDLALPTNLDASLQKLNSSLPTFAQVENFTDNAIRLPFEEVKTLINNSLGTFTFDRSLFPVPAKNQLTFCSDNNGINDFFDDIVDLVAVAKKIFIGVLLGAAILVCIPMIYREIRRWRTMRARAQIVNSGGHDPLDVVYIVSRPYTATAGIQVAPKFSGLTRRQTLIRWVIAYATSDAALFVLSLAIAGLFSAACQAILLKAVEKEVPDLTNEVGAFADKVIASLSNASAGWAHGTNAAIAQVNSDINNDMLGWVNITTGALNDTLNVFVNETMSVLNDTLGGTPLYTPILDVLNCLVLLKVQGIESALTWISDNAHVDVPTLPNNTFTIGAVASIADGDDPGDSFLSDPSDQASDKISAAVARVTNALENTIRTEALVATAILGVYVFIVLIAVIRALALWYSHDKTRGEGGPAPIEPIAGYTPPPMPMTDFRSDNQERFVNIPLHDVRPQRLVTPADKPSDPAPQYSPARNPVGDEQSYQDQKFGFAEQNDQTQGSLATHQGEFSDFKF